MSKLAALFLILVSAVASAEDVTRTISVTGFGSVETPPDRATMSLSIEARESTRQVHLESTCYRAGMLGRTHAGTDRSLPRGTDCLSLPDTAGPVR